eukprot:7443306-Prorocentrum_lima.AAC.1
MNSSDGPMNKIWQIDQFLADWNEEYMTLRRNKQVTLRQADRENSDWTQGFAPNPPRGPRPQRSLFHRRMTK